MRWNKFTSNIGQSNRKDNGSIDGSIANKITNMRVTAVQKHKFSCEMERIFISHRKSSNRIKIVDTKPKELDGCTIILGPPEVTVTTDTVDIEWRV
jgi:hypothetical protein